jgi:hypothetical protein
LVLSECKNGPDQKRPPSTVLAHFLAKATDAFAGFVAEIERCRDRQH